MSFSHNGNPFEWQPQPSQSQHQTQQQPHPWTSSVGPTVSAFAELGPSSDLISQKDEDDDDNDNVKRPMNSFLLWAKVTRKKFAEENPNLHNADISKLLGKVWNGMSSLEKRPFVEQAESLRVQHMRDYPNYRYAPKKKRKDRKNADRAYPPEPYSFDFRIAPSAQAPFSTSIGFNSYYPGSSTFPAGEDFLGPSLYNLPTCGGYSTSGFTTMHSGIAGNMETLSHAQSMSRTSPCSRSIYRPSPSFRHGSVSTTRMEEGGGSETWFSNHRSYWNESPVDPSTVLRQTSGHSTACLYPNSGTYPSTIPPPNPVPMTNTYELEPRSRIKLVSQHIKPWPEQLRTDFGSLVYSTST